MKRTEVMKGDEMRRWIAVVAVIVVGLVAACEREKPQDLPPEPVVPAVDPEAVEVPTEAEAEPEVEASPEPAEVSFSTWPGRDEQRTFELMWLGGDEAIELRQAPQLDSDRVATVTFLDGDQLDWSESMVRVMRPRAYRVDVSGSWSGLPYDVEYAEVEAGERSFEIEAGEILYLYQYDGEGTCFWGIEGEIVLSQCPGEGVSALEEVEVEGDMPWKPLEQQWWVKLNGGGGEGGWIAVEEAPVEVMHRLIEGVDAYDESDVQGELVVP